MPGIWRGPELGQTNTRQNKNLGDGGITNEPGGHTYMPALLLDLPKSSLDVRAPKRPLRHQRTSFDYVT